MCETYWKSPIDIVPMVTALLLSTVPREVTELQCIRTNQKFHHKFSVFECMKIAQNYAQVTLLLSHTIQYSKMLIFCWKALFHPGGGGSHIDMVYVYVPAFWGTFSQNLV